VVRPPGQEGQLSGRGLSGLRRPERPCSPDFRLYLPREWAGDRRRRKKCHVPTKVKFQEKWRIGLDQIARCRRELPHGWVAAADAFGRVLAVRAGLRDRHERYVLDVPCNTLVRDLGEAAPPRKGLTGRPPKPPFRRVDAWAALQPASAWQRLEVRAGEKGPLVVQAAEALRVQTKDEKGRQGPVERLVVLRSVEEKPKTWYTLSNAAAEVPLLELAYAHGQRHEAAEVCEEGNGEVGLDHYEVRGWQGWHHHMALALLALWFLILERLRVGEKKPALTVPQMREICTRLVRNPPPSPAQIAAEVNAVLRRNEEARIYHWLQNAGRFPPRRGQPPPTRGPP
jgi:SRSO17 transposase